VIGGLQTTADEGANADVVFSNEPLPVAHLIATRNIAVGEEITRAEADAQSEDEDDEDEGQQCQADDGEVPIELDASEGDDIPPKKRPRHPANEHH